MKPEPKKKTEWSEEPDARDLPVVVRDRDEQGWHDGHPPHEEQHGRARRTGIGRDRQGRLVRSVYYVD